MCSVIMLHAWWAQWRPAIHWFGTSSLGIMHDSRVRCKGHRWGCGSCADPQKRAAGECATSAVSTEKHTRCFAMGPTQRAGLRGHITAVAAALPNLAATTVQVQQ